MGCGPLCQDPGICEDIGDCQMAAYERKKAMTSTDPALAPLNLSTLDPETLRTYVRTARVETERGTFFHYSKFRGHADNPAQKDAVAALAWAQDQLDEIDYLFTLDDSKVPMWLAAARFLHIAYRRAVIDSERPED